MTVRAEVDDRQPAMPESYPTVRVNPQPGIVGSAVGNSVGHVGRPAPQPVGAAPLAGIE